MTLRKISRPSVAVPLLVFLLLAVVPFVANAADQSFYIALAARMVIYAIAASALNFVLGYGGMVSFGHALFFGLGAYSVGLPAFYGIHDGWLQLACCLAVCGGVALVTGAISLRTTGIAFIMITLAFAQMGYYLIVSLKQYGGDDGLGIAQASDFGLFNLGSPERIYAVALAVLVLTTWWLGRLREAPFGMALRGARMNARRVNAVGLPVLPYQLSAYVMSGMICGVAGMLHANLNAFASPSALSWTISGELIVMVVLGGMGSVAGPVMGALAFLGLEELLKAYTEHWMVIFGPLIVLMALAGKKGIVGMLQRFDCQPPAPLVPRVPPAAQTAAPIRRESV